MGCVQDAKGKCKKGFRAKPLTVTASETSLEMFGDKEEEYLLGNLVVLGKRWHETRKRALVVFLSLWLGKIDFLTTMTGSQNLFFECKFCAHYTLPSDN